MTAGRPRTGRVPMLVRIVRPGVLDPGSVVVGVAVSRAA